MFYPPHEIIFNTTETTYAPGKHGFLPVRAGKGYRSIVMKASKVRWPKSTTEILTGHLEISVDGGRVWRHMATWRDNGDDLYDETGNVFAFSLMYIQLSARPDKPVFTQDGTWLRATLECTVPLTTAITIERA